MRGASRRPSRGVLQMGWPRYNFLTRRMVTFWILNRSTLQLDHMLTFTRSNLA